LRSIVRGTSDEAQRLNRLQEVYRSITQRVQSAQTLNVSWLGFPLLGLLTDLYAWGDRLDDAFRLLHTLTEAYRQSQIPLGMAWCALLYGDFIASPVPLGRPILFNYYLRDAITETTTPADVHLFDRSHIQIAEARAAYTDALQQFTVARALRGEALARLRLAYLDALDGAWSRAGQGYADAQRLFMQAGDRINAWLATLGGVWVHLYQGEAEANLNATVTALAQEMKSNDALAIGLSCGMALAYVGREALTIRGDVDTARRAARLAQAIYAVLDAPRRQAQACGDRSDALGTLEITDASLVEIEAALHWLDEALAREHAEALDVRSMGMQLAQKLVSIYGSQFDAAGVERALFHAEKFSADLRSMASQEMQGLAQTMREAQSNPLALLNVMGMGDVEDIQRKIQVFAIQELLRLLRAEVAFYAPLARGVQAMEDGRPADAEPHFQQALQAVAERAERDFRRAMVFNAWRKYDEARAALQQYVASDMPEDVSAFAAMQQALDAQRAAAEAPQRKIGLRWMTATLFIQMKAWPDAREQLHAIAHETGPLKPLGLLPSRDDIMQHDYRALLAEGLGERTQALMYLAAAVTGLEARRRYLRQENLLRALSAQRTTQGIYTDWARVLAEGGDWVQAFDVAEMARARVLADALSGARAVTQANSSDETYRRYTEQTAQVERLISQLALAQRADKPDVARLNILQAELQQATAELDRREAVLSCALPHWCELAVPQAETLTLTDIARRLPRGTLLLAYLYFGERLLMWAVTRDGLVAQHCVDAVHGEPFIARPFAARALRWVGTLSGTAEANDVAGFDVALSQLLLAPFDTAIAAADHLLIVPYAELNMLPFQALPWHGQLLGLKKRLSYLPAAALLQYFRVSDPTATGALVIGDPEAMSYLNVSSDQRESLSPLPAARAEARMVSVLYGITPLIGAQATEQAVRAALAQHPQVIHLATHGYLQDSAPLTSGVALAQGEALSADELMGLHLKADVVVLSACETGRGKLQGSELVGLARGLIYAGARAVVVSLWKVDDIATAILMRSLHAILRQGASPARALAQAQGDLAQVSVQHVLEFCMEAIDLLNAAGDAVQAAAIQHSPMYSAANCWHGGRVRLAPTRKCLHRPAIGQLLN
jgi:CHAT domain-containing protein